MVGKSSPEGRVVEIDGPISYPGRSRGEDPGSPAQRGSGRVVGANGQVWMVDGEPAGTEHVLPRFNHAGFDASQGADYKVRILDGEVNGELSDPSMGSDDYTFDVVLGDEVWVKVTYDTGTLEITDRVIETGSVTPTPTFGILYIQILDLNEDSSTTPSRLVPSNTHCGDIVIRPHYTVLNTVLQVDWFKVAGEPAVTVT